MPTPPVLPPILAALMPGAAARLAAGGVGVARREGWSPKRRAA